MGKTSWFVQICSITAKGFCAAKDGGASLEDNPYRVGGGVQAQRRKAWERGFRRQRAGKPLDDSNG